METQAQLKQNGMDYLDRCWRSGYSCRERGLPASRCPFSPGSRERKEWMLGWSMAERDYTPSGD